MAEIKSAIELAMEKTKGLIMNEEEKESFAIKNLKEAVKAILRRFMEQMIGLEEIEKELEEIKGDMELKRSILLNLIVEEIDLLNNKEQLLKLIGIATGGLSEEAERGLLLLQQRFIEQIERKEILARQDVFKRLEEMGVTGDGIEVNLEGWDEWQRELEDTKRIFKARLVEWKDSLRQGNGTKG